MNRGGFTIGNLLSQDLSGLLNDRKKTTLSDVTKTMIISSVYHLGIERDRSRILLRRAYLNPRENVVSWYIVSWSA